MRKFLSMITMGSMLSAGCALDGGESAPDARDDRTAEEGAVTEAQEAITQAGIQYHDGPVMLGTVGVYFIWYGSWGSGAKQILVDFANNLGGSGWWNINTTYTDGANKKLSNAVSLLGQYQYTGASYAKSLSDDDVKNIVTNTITQGHLPKSANAVYMVLTTSDVDQVSSASSRFGDYCGWHWSTSLNSTWIKFAWVGNPAVKAPGCIPNNAALNGNLGVDGMVGTVAHELTEAATDPLGNAWYDANGDENADKCAWDHGQTLKTLDGAEYNLVLGSRKFLVQRNWVNTGSGYCAQSYSATDLCPNDAKKTQPGLCGCGKKEPYDVSGFKDAHGYGCADWKDYNCRQAQEQYGYTAAQEAAILANCSAACGVCPSN